MLFIFPYLSKKNSIMQLKQLTLNQYEPTRQQREFIESFYVVRKFNSFYRLNHKYHILDYQKKIIGVFYLVSLKHFSFKDIDTELSFIHKNTTPEVYIKTLEYHNFNENTYLIRMVFTNQKQFSDEFKTKN